MKRPSILLVNPWVHDFAAYDLWAKPLGLLLLATRLRTMGWEPVLIDCLDRDHPEMHPAKISPHGHGRFARSPIPRPEQLEQIPRVFSRYGVLPEMVRRDLGSIPVPKAILVTSMMTYWYKGVAETIRLLREAFPGIPLLLGGIYASLMPKHAQEHCAPDAVVIGPGEAQLASVLFRLTEYSGEQNRQQAEYEFSPALDLLRRVRFLPLLTTRGCPYKCSYCASAIVAPGFIKRAPVAVIDEIAQAIIRWNVTDVALYDDAFLVDALAHAVPVLREASEKFPDLRWHSPNGLHASAIDSTVAQAMKRAGFETIRIGLESTSSGFHARTGGKTDAQSFLNAVRHLRDAGFKADQIGAYLLVGLPGQTSAQIEDDVDLVLRAGALPRLAEYSPIPGTPMWPTALKQSRYPIGNEPLFHNCTLLPTAEPEIDWAFLQSTRKRIREYLESQKPLDKVRQTTYT